MPKTITWGYMENWKQYNEYSDGTWWLADERKWWSTTTPTITWWYSKWWQNYNEYSDWTTWLANEWGKKTTTQTNTNTSTPVIWATWTTWTSTWWTSNWWDNSTQINQLNEQIAQLNQTINQQNQQISDLNKKASELTSENEQLKWENERLQSKVTSLQNKINSLWDDDTNDFEQHVNNAQTKYNNAEEWRTTSVNLNTDTINTVNTTLWDRINNSLAKMGYIELPKEAWEQSWMQDNVVNDTKESIDTLTSWWWDVQQMKIEAAKIYRNSEARLKQMLDSWEINELQYKADIDKIKADPSMKILYT